MYFDVLAFILWDSLPKLAIDTLEIFVASQYDSSAKEFNVVLLDSDIDSVFLCSTASAFSSQTAGRREWEVRLEIRDFHQPRKKQTLQLDM